MMNYCQGSASDDTATILLTMLGSVLQSRSALYACGPLTSGLLFYEGNGHGQVDAVLARTANERKLSQFAACLRKSRVEPVIDPGQLRVRGWDGSDYGRFFLRVIDMFVKELHLRDGWESGRGATKEFVRCVESGIPIFNQAGDPVNASIGADSILVAISQAEKCGLSAEILRSRVDSLSEHM